MSTTMKIIKIVLLIFSASLAQANDLKDESTLKQQPQLVFYKFFTPTKLAEAASFMHHHNALTPRLLTFLSAPSNFYRLMIVPLIPPGVMGNNAKLVVKMGVGLETKFGQRDNDPSFVISDGHRFVGMIIVDKRDYPASAPCVGAEGPSGKTTTRHNDEWLPRASQSYYVGRYEIKLSLSDRWGTCFVPLDGGFSREMVYQYKLNPNNGLSLEIYGDDAKEKEGIKYIELSILQEN